jgi:allantoin racemase
MRILLVNPNTTEAVTESCAREARTVAASGTEIVPLTGEFGARVITSRAENAVAAHAVLTILARHHADVDAVLLAVSYDTALLAARELLTIPVVGMTEAALVTAHLVGSRFGLVTFGTPTVYRDLVAERGLSARLAGIRSIDTAASEVYANPQSVERRVIEAASALAKDDAAECVVLSGAAMAGFARRIKEHGPVPVLDGIACGVALCEMLVRLELTAPSIGSMVSPAGRETHGLDPALAALLGKRSRGGPN